MRVEELMDKNPVVVPEEATLEEAARILLKNRYGGLPVVGQGGRLKGVLLVEDLLPKPENLPFSDVEALQLFGEWVDEGALEEVYRRYQATRVKEVMRKEVPWVHPKDSFGKALEILLTTDFHHLPVVDKEGKVVGILSRSDFLKFILKEV
ncbi:MAG: histidine kinase [Thermus sp.]